jgi:hypothetical protein
MFIALVLVYLFHGSYYAMTVEYPSKQACDAAKYRLLHSPKVDRKRLNKIECRVQKSKPTFIWHKI